MKKIGIKIVFICTLLLVGCIGNTEKKNSNTNTSELKTSENISEETSVDSTTSEHPTSEENEYIQYMPNGKTSQLLIDVLINNGQFTFVQMDYPSTEKIAAWSKTLSTFNYEIDQFWDEPVEFGKYRVVDLDGDGYNEIIIDIPSTEALILHYEDDEVYGFMYPWLGVKTISTSGVMEGAEGGSHTMYSVMKFNKDTYTDTTIAESDYIRKEGKFVYYVEDESVSLDEYTEYISSEKFTEKVPYWSDYEMILTTK